VLIELERVLVAKLGLEVDAVERLRGLLDELPGETVSRRRRAPRASAVTPTTIGSSPRRRPPMRMSW